MPEVGSASLAIIPSFKGFQANLENGSSKALIAAGDRGGEKFGDAAGRSMSSKFTGYAKTAAKAGALALAGVGAAVLKIGADSIQAASDLSESTNKVQQVFGKGAEQVFKFSEKAADALGQTNQQARDAAATFGIFGRVAKLSGRDNAKFAVGMTKLASDLASFNNTSPEQAIEAIGAALRGESEPIRAYGVLLDEATLKAEALSMGLLKPVKDQAKIKGYQVAILEGQKKYNEAVDEYGAKSLEALKAEANLGTARDRLKKATEGTIPPLTQQQKVLAAQSSILKQTKVQQGDFARTSDGLANSQRRLTARWENAKATLGQALLPTVNRFVKFLLDKGIPAVEQFADWFNKDGVDKLKTFGGEVKTVAGHVKDLVGWLNDLPKPAKIAGLAALLGGIGYTKLRGGGGGGALGTAGKVLGIVKPVRTFETNPAALGGGLGGAIGAGGKLGSIARKAPLPVAIVAASAIALKGLWDWNHQDDKGNPLKQGVGGGRIGEWSRNFFGGDEEKVKTYSKTIGTVNNAWAKVRDTTGEAREQVKLYDGSVRLVPPKWQTTFEAVNLARDKMLVEQYGSLLDGLDRRTITTFFQAVALNKPGDVGEGSAGQPPNRSGPGGVNVHIDRVEAHDYQDFMSQMNNRVRGQALDGVR